MTSTKGEKIENLKKIQGKKRGANRRGEKELRFGFFNVLSINFDYWCINR